MIDPDAVDFFRGNELLEDPYPYFAALRQECPLRREPHHGVVMVTGYDEAVAIYDDTERVPSCTSVTGPFPGFPVPLEGDDTGLATAAFPDGSVHAVGDVVRIAANLFAAGQETTVRLLGWAVKLIAEDRALQALLRKERDKISNFIEETLRLESPVKGDFRLSKVPVTVGGVDLPAGTTVMLVNGAAGRDPRHCDDPDAFRVDRANARTHLAFGRGVHTYPGAPLARAEARVSLERLLDRTTDIRISEEHHGPPVARRYRYVPTFILRGLTHLHRELDPVEEGMPVHASVDGDG